MAVRIIESRVDGINLVIPSSNVVRKVPFGSICGCNNVLCDSKNGLAIYDTIDRRLTPLSNIGYKIRFSYIVCMEINNSYSKGVNEIEGLDWYCVPEYGVALLIDGSSTYGRTNQVGVGSYTFYGEESEDSIRSNIISDCYSIVDNDIKNLVSIDIIYDIEGYQLVYDNDGRYVVKRHGKEIGELDSDNYNDFLDFCRNYEVSMYDNRKIGIWNKKYNK